MNETPKIAAVIGIRWCIGLHISKVTSAQRRKCRIKITHRPIRMVTEKLPSDIEQTGFFCFLDKMRLKQTDVTSYGTNNFELSRLELGGHSGYFGNIPSQLRSYVFSRHAYLFMVTVLNPSPYLQLCTVWTDRSVKILVVNLRTICEMDGECGTRELEEKCMQGSCVENPTERGHLEELGVDGCKILKWV